MFLRQKDYFKQIKTDNLDVILGGDDSFRLETELAAQSEIESYLRHHYDVAKIFIDLVEYVDTDTYETSNLVSFPDINDELFSANVDIIAGETPKTEPTKWDKGDTRHPLIKMHLIDMTLYHLHSRINPRNIPDFRIARRDECIKWLGMIAKGQITIDLPVITDPEDEGLKIKWDSNEKFNHNYDNGNFGLPLST